MELETLNVTKQQAQEAVIGYRQAARKERRADYEKIRRGYNAIIRGHELIEISKVIVAGGRDDDGFPRLAIVRADRPMCYVRVYGDGRVNFRGENDFWHRVAASLSVEVRDRAFTHERSFIAAQSVAPIIPPSVKVPGNASRYHILFEADWHDVPRSDPALLQHLGGDLWAVLAVWDLTPLERAVLRGRR